MKKNGDKILLGAHMSIAGGIHKAIIRGEKIGCNTIQIFTKNTTQWKSKQFLKDDVDKFIKISKKLNINPIFAHTSYLINLASSNKMILNKSRKSFVDEIQRCEILKIPFLVMHPGSTGGKDIESGMKILIDSFNNIFFKKNCM